MKPVHAAIAALAVGSIVGGSLYLLHMRSFQAERSKQAEANPHPETASPLSSRNPVISSLYSKIAQYAGQDSCKIQNTLDSAEENLKSEFLANFNADHWETWASYSDDCGPIAVVDDSELGKLVLLPRVELEGSAGANSGKSAVIFLRSDGKIVAVCFADNGDNSDGGPNSEWMGIGWRKKVPKDECGYETSAGIKIDNLKARLPVVDEHNSQDMTKFVGRDICDAMKELDNSKDLRREVTALVGVDRWELWSGYSANCDTIEMANDAALGKLIVLPRRDPADAATSATLFVQPSGKIEAACFSDDGQTSEWIGDGWSKKNSDEECAPGTSTAEKIQDLKLAKQSASPAQ